MNRSPKEALRVLVQLTKLDDFCQFAELIAVWV